MADEEGKGESGNHGAGFRLGLLLGIIGVVISVKDTEDELTLKSEDSKIKVLKSSVVRVLGQDETETKV